MANVTVIVGTQWGNEGKGRIAHHVSKECIAIRATGSSRAGHTVLINGQKFTLHLLPAAIVLPNTTCIMALVLLSTFPALQPKLGPCRQWELKFLPSGLLSALEPISFCPTTSVWTRCMRL